MATKVESINHLKEILKSGKARYFFIQLNFGLRSSKRISLRGDTFNVYNCIDGSHQTLNEKELQDENITNVGKAIKHGAFFLV